MMNKETIARDVIRDSVRRLFPGDHFAFDYIWESIWDVERASGLESFNKQPDWRFESDSIGAGGVSGGAFSQETYQYILSLLHITAVHDENSDIAAVIESLTMTRISNRVSNALTDSAESILEQIETAVSNAEQVEVLDSESQYTSQLLWCSFLFRDQYAPHETAMQEDKIDQIMNDNAIDLVVHEPRSTIKIVHEQDKPKEHSLDQLGGNELGMLWLMMSCATIGYIRDEEFQNVRSKKERLLNEKTAYRNYVSSLKKLLGNKLASKWVGQHSKSGLPVVLGQLGYVWIRQHRDIKRSRLLAKSYHLKGL